MDGGRGQAFLKPAVLAALDRLERGSDGIYSAPVAPAGQVDEVRERERVARIEYTDLLGEVGRHHSIRVMDREARLFLSRMPADGIVVDIGCGWGWPWRRLDMVRPDICVVLVDMVRENLRLAARLLRSFFNERVFLVHADATNLPFPAAAFDGCWSVQAFQHISAFEQAVKEARRILRPRGEFACYSLNRAAAIEAVYRLAGRKYHVEGATSSFYLARASAEQADVVSRVFGSPVASRYTEVLFHPDLRLRTGAADAAIGAIDAGLSSCLPLFAWVARQRSFHTRRSL